MKLLLDSNNVIVQAAHDIEVGIYDEPFEKYALIDEEGNITMYALLDVFHTGEVTEIPEVMVPGKYLYQDGEIIENPDYEEPPIPVEEALENLTEDVEVNTGCIDEIADILSDNDETIETVSECLDESAVLISELYERIEALEAKIKLMEG